MKFWKILCNQINETLPDWQDKFLSYKDLKKRLKLIYPKQGSCNNHENSDIYTNGRPNKRPRLSDDEKEVGDSVCGGDDDGDEVTKEVTDFLERLEKEIEKFNRFFVDKEEFYIIRLQVYLLLYYFYFFGTVLFYVLRVFNFCEFFFFFCCHCFCWFWVDYAF